MTNGARRPLVVGNWKLHHGLSASEALARGVVQHAEDLGDVEIAIAPVFTALASVARILSGSKVALSAQDVYNSTTFRSARLTHSAWQVTGQWFLTGEKAGFGAVEPIRPFTLGSPGWGAWQVVARYSKFDVDDKAFPAFSNPDFSATDATSWSVGLNWWLNRNLRVLASFTHTSFNGGGAPVSIANPGSVIAPSTVTAQDENLFAARIQLSF